MGIPSYFSHIVRQHRTIIRKYKKELEKIDNLYLDANSIIYDAVQTIEKTEKVNEQKLIQSVCEKLIYYIRLIEPTRKVFITFDGVAPIAKLNQQRNRRYMTSMQQHMHNNNKKHVEQCDNNKWNTSAITPGTEFMKQLAVGIKTRFLNKEQEFGLEYLKISTADEAGEGEHKIYEYIREEPAYHKNTKTVIYGLDADLIMLTLNHLHISSELFLFRETPNFIQSVDKTLDPNELYLLDINKLGSSIIEELSIEQSMAPAPEDTNKIFDYIFMCFFLGNDFMPHFPALNIRTTGINHLMNAYKHVFPKKTAYNLTSNNGTTIIWKNVRKWVEHLSINEHKYIQDEYKKRASMSNNILFNNKKNGTKNTDTKDAADEDEFLNIPLKDRSVEMYINPFEEGWQIRYYRSLFAHDESINNKEICNKEICNNYLQGLEWTMKYYTTGCVDWRWKYEHHYPPLLCDLIKHVPYFDSCLVQPQPRNPVLPLVQLCYVLPERSLDLLPLSLKTRLLTHHRKYYTLNCDLNWAFCKYLWEAHACLPSINISVLEMCVNDS